MARLDPAQHTRPALTSLPTGLNAVVAEALGVEVEEAKRSGAVGYTARLLAQATMPHSDPGEVLGWGRSNGFLDLVIQPGVELVDGVPTSVGLPYGSIPRLLLAWLTTEAVRTKERRLMLSDTLSEFLEEIGLERTGGPRGGITRLRTQMRRLFSASVSATHTVQDGWMTTGVRIAHQAELWWDPKHPAQAAIWESSVTLSQEFYEEIVRRPIPVDLQALRMLKRSPLALDLYAWLTYRYSYLTKSTTIPWEALQLQFGADYAQTRQFKAKLLLALAKVHEVYPEARVEPQTRGLVLLPSRSHITRHYCSNT